MFTVLSADDQMEVMINGVQRGSCDYLVKPVHIEQVRSLWMHVVRKCQKCISGGIDNAGEKLLPGVADGENECGKKTRMQSRKKQKMDGLGTEVDKEKDNTSNEKKQRINWSGQLQTRFLAAVHHLGLDSKNSFVLVDSVMQLKIFLYQMF
jgi:two-component response regulator ARR-B family